MTGAAVHVAGGTGAVAHRKIALLIDADNSHTKIAAMLAKFSEYGAVRPAR